MSMATYSSGSTRAVKTGAAEAAKSGIWVGIAAITMSFAAFTSAIIVRQGTEASWQRIALPHILYWNTLVLLASSVTLELARRTLVVVAGEKEPLREGSAGDAPKSLRWLVATLALGLLFVLGQYAAWHQLSAQGLFLATNPSSSFFYVLTAVHGIHLLGGIAAIAYVIGKLSGAAPALRRSTFEAASIYWHFMGGLWVYLLLVMGLRL